MPAETTTLVLSALLAAGTAAAPEGEPPETELIEFLGTFETGNGKWLDPLTLDDTPTEPNDARREEKRP